MTAILSDQSTELLRRDFERACALLTEARWAQLGKDTPAARLQVELCRARVDAILDDRNEGRFPLR